MKRLHSLALLPLFLVVWLLGDAATPIKPAASGSIKLTLAPSRTSGVAPLYVFFDSTGTTSPTATSLPFHEIQYAWDFGDSRSGSWGDKSTGSAGTGANTSRNSAYGPVAAHVFETPGTYTMTLTAYDGTHTAMATRQIVIGDPNIVFSGANTVCVAATGLPVAGSGDCPSGARAYRQSDWPTIVNTYATSGKRVLLNRGDTFTGTATATLNQQGPGIIGAYGSGANPVIRTTAAARAPNSNIFRLNGSLSPVMADWRIMDLDFDGQSNANRTAMDWRGDFDNVLVLRIRCRDIGGCLEVAPNYTTAKPHDGFALVDSTIQNLIGGHGIMLAARRFAILGNLFDDSTVAPAEHMIRIAHAQLAVINNNVIQKVQLRKEMIALRGLCTTPCPDGSRAYLPAKGFEGSTAETRHVVISDNRLKTNTYAGIQPDTAGTNPNDTAIVHNVIIERNWHDTQAGAAGRGVVVRAAYVTVRNELFDLTNSVNPAAVDVAGNAAVAPGTSNLRVYNNTVIASGASVGNNGSLRIVNFPNPIAGISNVWIQNNLAYAPNAGRGRSTDNGVAVVAYDWGVTGAFVHGNNSTGAAGIGPLTNQIKLANPSFATWPPATPSEWRPAGRSYAIGGGAAVPVWKDFFNTAQPKPRDMGAVNQKKK